ncbi:MAG: transposase, partial [Chloroflexi bacterium]|nr:transposase [Chloroflexota bacterium]
VTPTEEFLGCDLGIVNILTDSDGVAYSGAKINGLRKRHLKLRQRLQKKGTRSCKRLLKKRSRKERRFARHVNHVISRKVVANAKDTRRGIALEDLKGIRQRITIGRPQRRSHHSWGFGQLRAFIEYKAALAGVKVVCVDPRNTSRTCPECGLIDKQNRPTQAVFRCVGCGFSGLADAIAAGIIASRAHGDAPDAASRRSV